MYSTSGVCNPCRIELWAQEYIIYWIYSCLACKLTGSIDSEVEIVTSFTCVLVIDVLRRFSAEISLQKQMDLIPKWINTIDGEPYDPYLFCSIRKICRCSQLLVWISKDDANPSVVHQYHPRTEKRSQYTSINFWAINKFLNPIPRIPSPSRPDNM